MQRVVVLQSSYLPWRGYFDLVHDADCFVFYDEVKYTKNDWRNRNRIVSPNGAHWLTIPVSHDAVHKKISEVLLPDSRWATKHYRSLQSAYGRTSYFAQLEPLLVDVFCNYRWTLLSELNQYVTKQIAQLIGIDTVFVNAKDYILPEGRIPRLLSVLKQVNATHYISGPSAKEYLEPFRQQFQDAGISVTFKDYSGYPEYPQNGASFEGAVSIVDLLAHVPLSQIPFYIWGWREGK